MKNAVGKAFSKSRKSTLKDVVDKEAKKENKDWVNVTPQKHKRVLKGAYKTFVILSGTWITKINIDGYVEQVKLQYKVLIGSQLKEMLCKRYHDIMGKIEEACKIN